MDSEQDKFIIIPHPKVFPYLVTKVAPAFYHIILLPVVEEYTLLQMASMQAQSNDLSTCLVLNENRGIYFNGANTHESSSIPAGGNVIMGMLKTHFDQEECIQRFPDYAQSYGVLKEFIQTHKGEGYVFGDITKGGKIATDEEKIELAGFNELGVPTGLTKCAFCGNWRGKCLDPSKEFEGKIMVVNCICENNNRCAKCHWLLYKFKLNANHFDPQDNKIWHVPGFSGLSHIC